jgi:hypothetical protein
VGVTEPQHRDHEYRWQRNKGHGRAISGCLRKLIRSTIATDIQSTLVQCVQAVVTAP